MNENAQHWLQLARYASERLESRQSYEWKLTLGLWAVLLATSYREIAFSASGVATGWWVLAWALFVLLWVRGVWVANCNDKLRAEAFLRLATGQSAEPYADPPAIAHGDRRWWFGFLGNWSCQFQALATAAIMIAVSKGTRDAISWPDSLDRFWWGECVLVTWGVLGVAVSLIWTGAYFAFGRKDRAAGD